MAGGITTTNSVSRAAGKGVACSLYQHKRSLHHGKESDQQECDTLPENSVDHPTHEDGGSNGHQGSGNRAVSQP